MSTDALWDTLTLLHLVCRHQSISHTVFQLVAALDFFEQYCADTRKHFLTIWYVCMYINTTCMYACINISICMYNNLCWDGLVPATGLCESCVSYGRLPLWCTPATYVHTRTTDCMHIHINIFLCGSYSCACMCMCPSACGYTYTGYVYVWVARNVDRSWSLFF